MFVSKCIYKTTYTMNLHQIVTLKQLFLYFLISILNYKIIYYIISKFFIIVHIKIIFKTMECKNYERNILNVICVLSVFEEWKPIGY